jgi:uncharacterized protein
MAQISTCQTSTRKSLQLVIKTTKYCNLRCTYCYEYKELGNKQRMQLDSLGTFFTGLRSYAERNGIEQVELVWHGGEPLMVPLEYYEALQALQQEAYRGSPIKVSNVVQSNLTVLTDRQLGFLQTGGFFRGIGVSFDVYGDQRIDTQGKLRTDAILKNIQRLMAAKVRFGAITVLARNTLPHVRSIYKFWDRLGVEFRFLPFYMQAFADQVDRHALSNDEIVDAVSIIFRDWLASERATSVDPIAEYVSYAVAHLAGEERAPYVKERDEIVFLVNVDGGVWGVGDAYDPALCYGNAFRQDFADILASPVRRAAAARSEARVEKHCRACPYRGQCPGAFVADATPEQEASLERGTCVVRRILDRMTGDLDRSGIGEEIARAGLRRVGNTALNIGV